LIPFYAAGYLGKDRKTVVSSLALFLILNAIWMVTLVSLTGGLSSYLSVLGKQTEVSFADTDITEQTARALLGVHTIPFRLIQACSITVLLALLFQFWKIRPSRRDLALLLITVPSLLFFLFVHYSKEGYLFVVYVPLLVFLIAQFGKLYENLALICIVFLLACFLNYRAFVKPPLYSDQEASQGKYKWVLNQLTFPNKHVINARTARLQDFLKTVDQLSPGPKLFVFLGEYTPDWRTLMYYRPDDETLLVAPRRKRASAAHNRVYQVVTSPYTLNPAIRTVVALSKEEPGMKMNSFELYEYRYFYSLKRDLPGRFQIYGFEFER
jgi:hypothetical protein